VLSLLDHGYTVTILDNLDNSFLEAFNRMKELAGDKAGGMTFIKVRTAGPGDRGTHVLLRL
jgi:UDP-glucose 4-epimerase